MRGLVVACASLQVEGFQALPGPHATSVRTILARFFEVCVPPSIMVSFITFTIICPKHYASAISHPCPSPRYPAHLPPYHTCRAQPAAMCPRARASLCAALHRSCWISNSFHVELHTTFALALDCCPCPGGVKGIQPCWGKGGTTLV